MVDMIDLYTLIYILFKIHTYYRVIVRNLIFMPSGFLLQIIRPLIFEELFLLISYLNQSKFYFAQ